MVRLVLRNVEFNGSKQTAQHAPGVQFDVNRLSTILNVPIPFAAVLEEINRRALRPQSIHMDIETSAWPQNSQHFLNG